MYLIVQGTARVFTQSGLSAIVTVGAFLGDVALVSNIPRTASVIALSEVVVVQRLDRSAFVELLRTKMVPSLKENRLIPTRPVLEEIKLALGRSSSRSEFLKILSSHRQFLKSLPLPPTSASPDQMQQVQKDLIREDRITLCAEHYEMGSIVNYSKFIGALRQLASDISLNLKQSHPPLSVCLPPSLIAFMPLVMEREEQPAISNAKTLSPAQHDEKMVDAILQRLLIATSRTGSGGDSYAYCFEMLASNNALHIVPDQEHNSSVTISRIAPTLMMIRSVNTYKVLKLSPESDPDSDPEVWCYLSTTVTECQDFNSSACLKYHQSSATGVLDEPKRPMADGSLDIQRPMADGSLDIRLLSILDYTS